MAQNSVHINKIIKEMPPKKLRKWVGDKQALHSFGKSKGVGRPTATTLPMSLFLSFLIFN